MHARYFRASKTFFTGTIRKYSTRSPYGESEFAKFTAGRNLQIVKPLARPRFQFILISNRMSMQRHKTRKEEVSLKERKKESSRNKSTKGINHSRLPGSVAGVLLDPLAA